MATKAQNAKLGALLLAAAAVLLILLVFVGGMALLAEENTYFVVVDDSVSGLEAGSPVKILGVPVGTVDTVELVEPHAVQVKATFSVDADNRINKGAKAYLKRQGVTELRYIDIGNGDPSAGPLPPGSELEHGETPLDQLMNSAEAVAQQTEKLMSTIDGLVGSASGAVDGIDPSRLNELFASAEGTMNRLEGAAGELEALMRESREVVRESRQPLRQTLEQTAAAASSARSGFDKADIFAGRADVIIADVRALVQELSQTVGGNDEQVRRTLLNLRQASESIERFAEELRRDPSKILFGDPPAERKLP